MCPVEVWLTQRNIEVICRVVNEDESGNTVPITSLSMRGAQREVTTQLREKGYIPAGRWAIEAPGETSRRFTPARSATSVFA